MTLEVLLHKLKREAGRDNPLTLPTRRLSVVGNICIYVSWPVTRLPCTVSDVGRGRGSFETGSYY